MDVMSNMNWRAHKERPLTPKNKRLTLWRPTDSFMHCCIASRGCRFSCQNGACIMCDYGIGHNLNSIELKEALEKDLQPQMNSLSTLLLGSYGSIFDEGEVSQECFDVILNFLKKQQIRTVIFETHCSTVNEHILDKIRKELSANNFKIIIEMGYESCDPYILKNYLNKLLDLEQLSRTIDIIHRFSMEVSLNVFLGTPFLSDREQLDTAVEAVEWAFKKGADSIVVFPCNIKPFTLLNELYKNKLYDRISQWMVVELLNRIPKEKLNRISLSWYGERKNFYENDEFPLVPPEDCEKCHDILFNFYHAFMSEPSYEKRKIFIEELINLKIVGCECHEKFLHRIQMNKDKPSEKEVMKLLKDIQVGRKNSNA